MRHYHSDFPDHPRCLSMEKNYSHPARSGFPEGCSWMSPGNSWMSPQWKYFKKLSERIKEIKPFPPQSWFHPLSTCIAYRLKGLFAYRWRQSAAGAMSFHDQFWLPASVCWAKASVQPMKPFCYEGRCRLGRRSWLNEWGVALHDVSWLGLMPHPINI